MEPEDNNKIWFQILDDTGVNVNVGAIQMAGGDLFDSSKNLTSVRCIGVNTADPNVAGRITATENIISNTSDARLKTNVTNITGALDKVMSLNGVTYNWNDKAIEAGFSAEVEEVGLIAQEVQEVLPQVIFDAPFDRGEEGESISGENYITLQYERIVPLLVEAIKELKAEINSLKGEA
jgi:hypothetical protein